MKILGVNSAILPDANKQSQVDWWRIHRPLQELKKHVDWQIDEAPSFIVGLTKHMKKEEFTAEEMEKAFKVLTEYDIVFASYHPDPTSYTMLKVAADKAGTQFVMDCDDDMFSINPDNPFWMKMTDEKVYWMQRMIADNTWITTPSPVLAKKFAQRRGNRPKPKVIHNFIPKTYKHPPFDNGENIVIGYMGGSSHYADLHDSGALDAVAKIMHEYKNVRFKSVGMILDKYLPVQRTEFEGGKRGQAFFDDVFPSLRMDIALGPLLDNEFNRGKSNIKWQEMTRAGAVFVGSNVGPYRTIKRGVNALLVDNDETAWYVALKQLIENKEQRATLLENAQKELADNWQLEDNWEQYKTFFEEVYNAKNNKTE